MAMRMSSTAAIQDAAVQQAPHNKSRQRADTGVALMAMRMSSTAAIQDAAAQQAPHNKGRSERRADWIRRARRERSGLNGHEHPEHSPDSICMPRSKPLTTKEKSAR